MISLVPMVVPFGWRRRRNWRTWVITEEVDRDRCRSWSWSMFVQLTWVVMTRVHEHYPLFHLLRYARCVEIAIELRANINCLGTLVYIDQEPTLDWYHHYQKVDKYGCNTDAVEGMQDCSFMIHRRNCLFWQNWYSFTYLYAWPIVIVTISIVMKCWCVVHIQSIHFEAVRYCVRIVLISSQ